jgi:predicted phosphodiesterase
MPGTYSAADSRVIKESNVDFVLYGHWHITGQYELTDATPVLNGGGSLDGNFNLIEVGRRHRISFTCTGRLR